MALAAEATEAAAEAAAAASSGVSSVVMRMPLPVNVMFTPLFLPGWSLAVLTVMPGRSMLTVFVPVPSLPAAGRSCGVDAGAPGMPGTAGTLGTAGIAGTAGTGGIAGVTGMGGTAGILGL